MITYAIFIPCVILSFKIIQLISFLFFVLDQVAMLRYLHEWIHDQVSNTICRHWILKPSFTIVELIFNNISLVFSVFLSRRRSRFLSARHATNPYGNNVETKRAALVSFYHMHRNRLLIWTFYSSLWKMHWELISQYDTPVFRVRRTPAKNRKKT